MEDRTIGTISLNLPSDGQSIDASDVNNPFNTIAAVINGGIDADNIEAAGVVPSALVAGTGTSWAWQSWVPTWTTLTIGNATQACKYIQIGKTVVARIDVVLGSTSAMGTGKPTFTLPVTATSATASLAMATVRYNAGGVLALGQIQLATTTTGALCDYLANGTYVTEDQLTSAAPGTWATSSTITGTFVYEAA